MVVDSRRQTTPVAPNLTRPIFVPSSRLVAVCSRHYDTPQSTKFRFDASALAVQFFEMYSRRRLYGYFAYIRRRWQQQQQQAQVTFVTMTRVNKKLREI